MSNISAIKIHNMIMVKTFFKIQYVDHIPEEERALSIDISQVFTRASFLPIQHLLIA